VSNSDKWFSVAAKLFSKISKDLGAADARRIFTSISAPRTPKQEAVLRNMELLSHYDTMMPKPNVQKLARQFAEANKTLPVERRYGPRGSTDPLVLDKHIFVGWSHADVSCAVIEAGHFVSGMSRTFRF
jgi:hypothetical protein